MGQDSLLISQYKLGKRITKILHRSKKLAKFLLGTGTPPPLCISIVYRLPEYIVNELDDVRGINEGKLIIIEATI